MGRDEEKSDIIRTLLSDVLETFKKANNELLIEAAEKSPLARKIIESQQEFLSKAKHWSKITDEDYLRLRKFILLKKKILLFFYSTAL